MKQDVTFEETLLLLGQEVIRVLMDKGSTLQDAEDAVSKTYDTIFSSLIYVTEDNLRPWFFRVSFNNYIDLYRKKKREKELIFHYADSQGNVTNESENLWMIIDSLKSQEQELLIFKYYYRLSYEDIASMLDQKVETVKKQLYRARKKLKANWEDE
ncbi:RNA polymerase sigma factor [Enterococcus casseliflavus]|uniref:RNA polymerase sigma factor n=1 Tax=Enterococcus casseliflavus TaxID=37734 RepID=UPI0039A74313